MTAIGDVSRWAAHEAAATVTGPIVQKAAAGYLDARDLGRGARRIVVGSEGVRRDGRHGEHAISAGEWFHGASDRTNALAQLGIDFMALRTDLGEHAISPSDASWVVTEVVPTLAAWEAFVAREASSSIAPWVTEWSVYETWEARLLRLRELARARGIALASKDPIPLPKTVWQRGATGEGSPLDTWMGFLKTAIFGAIALTGFVSFYVILRDFHRGRGE